MDFVKHYSDVGTIESTFLGYEDHGIFIGQVCFTFGNSGQCIQACLDPQHTDAFIKGIIKTVGVSSWEELVGQRARVLRDTPYGIIRAIQSVNAERYYRW